MSVNLQQLLVALVMLVPGFIVTRIQRGFRPTRFPSQFEWFVSSILHGVVLNAALLFAVLWFVPDYRSTTLLDASEKLQKLSVQGAVFYLTVLYLFAVAWGAVSGRFSFLELRAITNRLGLTPYAEHSSVWARIFDKQVPANRSAIWIRFDGDDGAQCLGRLRHSSEVVELDKPIELYLSPLYVFSDESESWDISRLSKTGEKSDGCYMRLTSDSAAQFLFREQDWAPFEASAELGPDVPSSDDEST